MAETKINKEIKEKLSYVQGRVSALVDEIHVLKGDLNTFKQNVANDLKRLLKEVRK